MIDWARVTELRDEIGDEDFAEVVDLFLDEVGEGVERLRPSLDAGALESELHFLKGSALNLGFMDFSKLCEAGEKSAAAGQTEGIDLGAICDSFAKSKSTFEAELRTRLAA